MAIVCRNVDRESREADFFTDQKRGRQSASAQQLGGPGFVCRDVESLLRSERHKGSFLWARPCVFITPTPQKTKVGVVC